MPSNHQLRVSPYSLYPRRRRVGGYSGNGGITIVVRFGIISAAASSMQGSARRWLGRRGGAN